MQAIHPGYGFLAENSHFAEVCRDCDIAFIGPTPEAMAMLGDKNSARKMARQAEVPTVPGSEGLIESEAQALQLAQQLGFPVLIKASAGGGGRGMRVALNELALKSALQQAQAEAEAAFGNAEIYLEKYVEHPRHVEVQVIADLHGNAVHLWERDCTMQRRHQKLIEESPAPNLPVETRKAMCEAAVRLVKLADYHNAGTVEFIVDKQGNYYFIEMNARIQVEHPVTEMVTGIDLIKSQILRGRRRAAAVPAEGRRPSRLRDRMPHQRRGPGEELPSHAGPDHADPAARRVRRAVRFARPPRLHGFAVLRLDDRQADRPPADARRGDRLHEAGLAGVAGRGHQDDHLLAGEDPQPRGLYRTSRRHHVHRADVEDLKLQLSFYL